jgi:hypothetical protein
MGFMPGDNRARNAYDDWCTAMGGTDSDGRVLRRWEQLTGQEKAAWETMTESVEQSASRAAARMNSPTAGLYGPPVSGTAGVTGYPASAAPVEYRTGVEGHASGGFLAASAVPLMNP